MPSLTEHELYAQKLLRYNHGYALFAPDPCGVYDRVRVGDVGYILDGKFIRLFNAFHEANSPVNRGATLPDNFVPIRERFRSLDVILSLPAGPMTSERVRAFRVEGTLSASGPSGAVAAGMKMKLQCELRSGAALLMHYPANRERAFADKAMEDYIVANHASWLAMVREDGRSLHLNDLIFVRDCTLTGDWATVVWDELSFSSELSFSIGTTNVADASISVWGAWEDQVTAPKRQGPDCTDRNREAYGRREFDQCIFLKGLRVTVREWYRKLLSFVKVKNAEEGGFDIDPSRPTVLRYFKRVGFKVETIGDTSSTFRPVQNCYDLMAIFIFENSDVDIAVVDDNDLNVFDRGQMGSLESMCDALVNKGYIRVVISMSGEGRKEKGESSSPSRFSKAKTTNGYIINPVGRISWRDPEPSVFSEQDIIVLDESYQPLHEDVPSSTVEPVSVPETEPSSQKDVASSSVKPVVSSATESKSKGKESETKKHKKRSSEYKTRYFTTYSQYSPFSSTESEVIATPPSGPSGVASSSVASGSSEMTHKGSGSQPSSSDDHVVIHVCEGPADECPQCLGAAPLPDEENPGLIAGLTEALEELSTNDFMDEFA